MKIMGQLDPNISNNPLLGGNMLNKKEVRIKCPNPFGFRLGFDV